jgi:hypothetical protein
VRDRIIEKEIGSGTQSFHDKGRRYSEAQGQVQVRHVRTLQGLERSLWVCRWNVLKTSARTKEQSNDDRLALDQVSNGA